MMAERKKRRKKGSAAGLLFALILLVFLAAAAVVMTLNLRWLYYQDIQWMNLEQASGMSADAIRRNYDALIDYNLVWNRGPLVFPSLPMSQGGRIHFEEVKRIFDGIQIACIVSGVLSLWILIATRRTGRRWLKITGILGLGLPAALGVLVAAGWEHFFVTFHQLVFQNDYWLFDPATDPVILILPDGYFLQCAVLILALLFAGSILCLVRAGKR